ncbi:hypothetical protein K402DRAFT_234976 [Aulographum hederae CBS 113979]|uniref:FYVE-type domain-containing protein n=1 Tax=Aulographum hederae CBS 113979 TaxID=1176131 RepID=A0A6G1GL16_9PEZI|nr:hypothetical protein K402DRAFT_234976 [Aulographum hederae CBS 113979]
MAVRYANKPGIPPTPYSHTQAVPIERKEHKEETDPRQVCVNEHGQPMMYNHAGRLIPLIKPKPRPDYVPAVLRPTEKPQKPGQPEQTGLRMNGSYHLRGDSFGSNISRQVSNSYDWSDDMFCEVTGPPTKNHWKPDSSVHACQVPSCKQSFSFISRRHHCRRCGDIYCTSHSDYMIQLDQEARFHPHGSWARSCALCYWDWKDWVERRAHHLDSRSNSDASGTPSIGIHKPKNHPSYIDQVESELSSSLAQSMPRDWSWSTF